MAHHTSPAVPMPTGMPGAPHSPFPPQPAPHGVGVSRQGAPPHLPMLTKRKADGDVTSPQKAKRRKASPDTPRGLPKPVITLVEELGQTGMSSSEIATKIREEHGYSHDQVNSKKVSNRLCYARQSKQGGGKEHMMMQEDAHVHPIVGMGSQQDKRDRRASTDRGRRWHVSAASSRDSDLGYFYTRETPTHFVLLLPVRTNASIQVGLPSDSSVRVHYRIRAPPTSVLDALQEVTGCSAGDWGLHDATAEIMIRTPAPIHAESAHIRSVRYPEGNPRWHCYAFPFKAAENQYVGELIEPLAPHAPAEVDADKCLPPVPSLVNE